MFIWIILPNPRCDFQCSQDFHSPKLKSNERYNPCGLPHVMDLFSIYTFRCNSAMCKLSPHIHKPPPIRTIFRNIFVRGSVRINHIPAASLKRARATVSLSLATMHVIPHLMFSMKDSPPPLRNSQDYCHGRASRHPLSKPLQTYRS